MAITDHFLYCTGLFPVWQGKFVQKSLFLFGLREKEKETKKADDRANVFADCSGKSERNVVK